jgi:hypothetical protein
MGEKHELEYVAEDGEILCVPIYEQWQDLPKDVYDRYYWSLKGRRIKPHTIAKAALLLPNQAHANIHKFYYSEDQTEPFQDQFTLDLHRFMGWFSPFRYDFIRHPDDHSAKFKHANRRWGWKDVRKHVFGQAQIGVIGDQYARYLIFDVDYHASDTRWELFLARCKVFYKQISTLAQQLDAAWFVECRQNNIQGVRFILILKKELWIPKLQEAAQAFLTYLDNQYPMLAEIESFQHIEVFPQKRQKNRQGVGCRLPLGVDITREGILGRVTITDEFLTHGPKKNLRRFVEWVDQRGTNVPLEEFMKFMIANTPKHTGSQPQPKKDRPSAHPGAMGSLPYKLKGNLKRLLRDFKLGNIPPDTIGTYIAIVARLLHFWGGDAEEVIQACIDRWHAKGVDTAFSDRVSFNEEELWRVFGYLQKAIENGNGYQAESEKSTEIFRQVVACWRQKGFDPVAYLLEDEAELPFSGLDISDVDFKFTRAQKALLREDLHPVVQGYKEVTIEDTYECALRVIKFIIKYPEREFGCVGLLPVLCADLAIKWTRNKCYAVMRCLSALQFVAPVSAYANGRSWLWRGNNKELNKARRFELGEALQCLIPLPPVSTFNTSLQCWSDEEKEEFGLLEREYEHLSARNGIPRHVLLSG